jgi:predicted amidohydrolase YtcJ
MKRRFVLGLLASAIASNTFAAPPSLPPVTVFDAAKIITMEPSLPSAHYVAVADGIVLGSADTLDGLRAWTTGRQVIYDHRFAKNVLMPGLIDPHVHPTLAAVSLNLYYIAPDDWNLPSGYSAGVQTRDGYRTRLKDALAQDKSVPFITWGYHSLFHGELDRAELDRIAPDRPVIVWQRSFHEVIMNSTALARYQLDTPARIDAAIKAAHGVNPEHVDLAKGTFTETGLQMALVRLQPDIFTPAKVQRGIAEMQKMMLNSGVTTISDMGTGTFAPFAMEADMIKAAWDRADNPSRVMLMPMANGVGRDVDLDAWYAGNQAKFASSHIRVDRRIKMLADGAFFSLNMQMNPPGYSDGHDGKWLTEPDVFDAQFQRFWVAGFNLHIHVNGDKGLDEVLAGLERLPPRPAQTITLEHLGFSTESQNRRIARLGLYVSAQPNYIRMMGDVYETAGLGADRATTMNRLGSLERKGVPLGLHSDFNMAPIDPLYLAWIACNRITIGGHVKAPEERLSLDKALRAITIEAAQVIGMDATVGSIAAGKKADFAVLDRDPYVGGPTKLREVKVLGVVYEGKFFSR